MALKRALKRQFTEPSQEIEDVVAESTLTNKMFEMLFVDDVETPPKTNKSKLETTCANLDIPPVVKTLELNSAEDVEENMSCRDAWLEAAGFDKDIDAAEDKENMSCMDAWKLKQAPAAKNCIFEEYSSDESDTTRGDADLDALPSSELRKLENKHLFAEAPTLQEWECQFGNAAEWECQFGNGN